MVGAGVVVAAIAVVGIAGALTAGSAAAASAASGDSDKSKGKDHSKPETPQSSIENNPTPTEAVDQGTVILDHISGLKEQLLEEGIERLPEEATPEQTASLIEKTRNLHSHFVHEAIETAVSVIAVIPEAMQDIRDLLPQGDSWLTKANPIDVLSATSAFFHKGVDWLFSTNKAESYIDRKPGKEGCKYGIVPLTARAGKFVGKSARIPPTQALSVNGWKLGDDIRNRTYLGNVPKWSTVRSRYWKNQAYLHSEDYQHHELERMKKGLAPQRLKDNGLLESKELHHVPPQREGGLFDFVEVWPEEHSLLDDWRHLGG